MVVEFAIDGGRKFGERFRDVCLSVLLDGVLEDQSRRDAAVSTVTVNDERTSFGSHSVFRRHENLQGYKSSGIALKAGCL